MTDPGRPAGGSGALRIGIVSGVMMIASVVGNLGFAMAIDRRWILVLAGAFGLVAGGLVEAVFGSKRPLGIAARTVLRGALAAVFPIAAGSVWLTVLYAAIRGLAGLFNRFSDWIEWGFHLPPVGLGVGVVATLACLLVPMFSWQAARQLVDQIRLSDSEPQPDSPPRSGREERKRRLALWGGVGVGILALFFAWWALSGENPKPVLAGFLVSYATATFVMAFWTEQQRRARAVRQRPESRIRAALAEAGFEFADLAPESLGHADFLARRNGEGFLIEVRTPANTKVPVDWSTLASLNMARWQLGGAPDSELGGESIHPVLVLVDVEAHDSLERPELGQGVRIVRFEGRQLAAGEAALSEGELIRRIVGSDDRSPGAEP